MNGTSAGDLLEGYCEASQAIRDAIEKINKTSPNGRDYYPVPGSITPAMEEHCARLAKLREVLAEIDALAVAVSDQQTAALR
jgi:hypothetical protein